MKILLHALIIGILFCTSAVFSDELNNDLILTNKQQSIVEEIKTIYSIQDAIWINTYTIDVVYRPDYMDGLSKTEANERADELSKIVYKFMGKYTCIKVSVPGKGELAHKCEGEKTAL